jgi:hypothetical protein
MAIAAEARGDSKRMKFEAPGFISVMLLTPLSIQQPYCDGELLLCINSSLD